MAVGVDPVGRDELHVALLDQFQSARAEGVHLHEPLVGQIRLDYLTGAVAARHLQLVRLGFDQQIGGFKIGQHGLARFVTILPAIFFRRIVVERGFGREQVDHRQPMPLPHRVVVEVVRRRHLDHAGAEIAFDVVIGDDGNLASGQRQRDGFADQAGVTRIVWMHHHRDVAEQGFRARGRNDQMVAGFAQGFVAVLVVLGVFVGQAIGQRVADRPEETVFLLAHHFQIGNRGFQHRIPVDQALAAIDQAFVVQFHESFDHGLGWHFVHREHTPRPVAGGTDAAHLALDGVARFLLPFPYFSDEALAPERVAGFTLAFDGQIARDDHLRGDAGVIGADLPQGVEATQAVVADQRIHQRVLEGVPHVQRAGDVGRRQQDGVGRAFAAGREAAALLPVGVPAAFEIGGFVAFVHARAGRLRACVGSGKGRRL